MRRGLAEPRQLHRRPTPRDLICSDGFDELKDAVAPKLLHLTYDPRLRISRQAAQMSVALSPGGRSSAALKEPIKTSNTVRRRLGTDGPSSARSPVAIRQATPAGWRFKSYIAREEWSGSFPPIADIYRWPRTTFRWEKTCNEPRHSQSAD